MHPHQVPQAMEELTSKLTELLITVDSGDAEKHALTIATWFHQQFLNVIHPFSDGNGRIGRIFTNLILLKSGYPPIFIKETNRDEYLKCFENSDNDLKPMFDFMADRLLESLEEKMAFITSRQ